MFRNFGRKIEVVANLTIIIVAAVVGIAVVKNYLFVREGVSAKPTANQAANKPSQLANGTLLTSLDVDWKQSPQTLVLAISSGCHFCTDSAAFYKTLAQNRGATRIIAVLPQPVDEGKSYLQTLGVPVDEVRQLPLDKIGVHGTPTLLLVDKSGSIKDSWVGKVTAEKETDIVRRLQL